MAYRQLGRSGLKVSTITLAKSALASVIVGARTEEQLRDNLAAAELSLAAPVR